MSVELIVEVLLHAPPTLTPAEKLLLTVIAESCNSATRTTWYRSGWDAEEVARRAHLTVGSLSKTFWSMAQKGCEVRVAHGTDKHGKPIFAHKGKQTTFKLPRFAPQRVDDGPGNDPQRSDEDRTFTDDGSAKGPTYVGERSDEDRSLEAQRSDVRRTLLLKDLPSKNTSSLSPREDEQPTAAAVPAQRTERENDDAPQKPETEEPTPIHRLLLDAGCPLEDLDEAEAELIKRHEPRSPAWWRTVSKNGDLPDLVAEVLEALQPVRPQLTAEHIANAHDFQPKTDGSPTCAECDLPKANGRHRVGNQRGGYVAQVSRSPADQRLIEGAQLYAKYKARETAGHKPWRNYADPSVYDEDWPTT